MTGVNLLNQLGVTDGLPGWKSRVIYSNPCFLVLGLQMLFIQVRPRISICKSITNSTAGKPSNRLQRLIQARYRFIQNMSHQRCRITSEAIPHTQKCRETREFLGGDGIVLYPDGRGGYRNLDTG